MSRGMPSGLGASYRAARVTAGTEKAAKARSRASLNSTMRAAGTGSAGGIARCAVSGLMKAPFSSIDSRGEGPSRGRSTRHDR
jgi:hypothetical protein